MNKQDFICKVAERMDADSTQAANCVNTVFDAVTDVVASGERLIIPGFGTFGTSKRSERNVRNPQTGEPMTVPACVVPVFKAGKGFKEAVSG